MSTPNPGYSITVRVQAPAVAGMIGDLTTAIGEAGGVVTPLDVAESHETRIVVDVTCNAADAEHVEGITEAIAKLDGFVVRKVSDRTFLMHLGGKLEVVPKVQLRHRDDLSRAYTPGVARVSQAIARNPEDARRLTIKRNTVAVLTDGSAVLGLGNIGPAAALPVMEGKAALFKRFADVDAWPVCLDTQDTDEIVEIARAMAPVYGGINLEDIAAPRCFEIEARLRELLDIPVFHDDQHGTAIVVLAALTNALRVVGKTLPDVRILVSGAGAAGQAIIRLLLAQGARDVVAFDTRGAVHTGREGLDRFKTWIAEHTNAAGVGTGRSDYPNQINNVLAFPGVFRGLLDAGAREITDEMLVAAAQAIADAVRREELNASYIVPSVFDPEVAPAVAAAVRDVASRTPGAHPRTDEI